MNYKKYMVVDRVTNENLGEYDTLEEAHGAWQKCWMGKDSRYPVRFDSSRFGYGFSKNMKRRLVK